MVTALRDQSQRVTPVCAWPAPFARLALLLVFTQAVTGCSTVGFYRQAVSGQLAIMRSREPIQQLLEDGQLSPALHAKLQLVQEIRKFASEELDLPIQDQFTSYVDLGRPYAVWNVFATPEFSTQPMEWCFPIAGCVSYRGYFGEQDAEGYAQQLRSAGLDVYVGGVVAYSSLGWFSDPVLSSFITRADWQLASLVFHELAHQLAYVPGDTDFNESFATAVEMEGLSRWLTYKYPLPEQGTLRTEVETFRARQAQFVLLIRQTTQDLEELYAAGGDPMELRSLKRQRLDELREDYVRLRAQWAGYGGYDQWFEGPLNNAQLATVTLYNRYLPFFQRLLGKQSENLGAFYTEVKKISKMPKQSREAVLSDITEPDLP